MKILFNKSVLSVILTCISLFFLIGCGGVTETGNPCPAGGCPEAGDSGDDTEAGAPAAGNLYENDTYGVTIYYPSDWTAEESAEATAEHSPPEMGEEPDAAAETGYTVVFSSAEEEATTAYMTIIQLDTEPDSLAGYLAEQYPGYTFEAYNTSSLSGYLYDNPSLGTNGGDKREYFFLEGAILVYINAEVFTEGEEGFETLLDSITFI